jgi:hypothetical protein
VAGGTAAVLGLVVTAGWTRSGDRRIPGLRREELARLAGLSVDCVVRLE